MARNFFRKRGGYADKFTSGVLLLSMFLSFGINIADATTTVKILSDSRHEYGAIIAVINQLMGTGHIGTDFIVHSTNMNGSSGFSIDPADAIDTITQRYDQNGTLVPSAGPYQMFTTSATGYQGDNVNEFNTYSPYDLNYNYAYSNSPVLPATTLPPTFHSAPGGSGYPSNYGVEWTLNPAIFNTSTLSSHTASNAGMMAVLRFLHPTWNWFDVKAALRQTGTNWPTGYDRTTYGFGQVNYATATALLDSQILLQPPASLGVVTSLGYITFTLYPFKQSRRVKDVLFQFPSAPAFQANELTLGAIQALGGTKVAEYTNITATTTRPFSVSSVITNGYFAWLTADNANDAVANFSRIDTYSVQGPLSQDVPFNGTFNIVSPVSDAIATTTSPTFTWGAASSHLGITKYQLFIDGLLDTDNIIGTSTTPANPLSDGTHTWYVKAWNGGGAATTTTATPTLNVNTGYTSGYTFYVDNVLGNDTNPGTGAQPWATFGKAASTASAGDTVMIIKNAGVPYRETLTPTRSGTATSSITFRGVDANNKPEIWGSTDVSSGWSVYVGGNPNTYQHPYSSLDPFILATGASISTLTPRTLGDDPTTLGLGQWSWSSNTLYYRLALGESTSTLHVEVGLLDSGIRSDLGFNYITYQNLIVRYTNTRAAFLYGDSLVAQGIEVYDSLQGFYLGGSSNILRYSIAARNIYEGIAPSYSNNVRIYNSLTYGNGTNGLTYSAYTSTTTLKNILAAANTGYSFAAGGFSGTPMFITSNNLWDIAGDTNWDTRKGTNNQELVNPLLIAPSSNNFQLQELSPAIDSGTSGSGATTDILGNPIYGTPDIGPYEYQPPYTVGVDNIDTTGSVRIYKNGKYRYTSAHTGGPTAHMTVTPVGGFLPTDYSEFLNITITKWNTSGDFAKTWTETSTSATTTLHSVGNMNPGELYNVTIDGVTPPYTQARADTSGTLTFTYTGGYSTHTFDLTKYDAGGTSYIYGCTDPVATNYDATATSYDNRCTYAPATSTTPLAVDEMSTLFANSTTVSASSTVFTATTSAPLASTTDSIATSTAHTDSTSTARSLFGSFAAISPTTANGTISSSEENIFSAVRFFSRAVVRTLSFGMRGDDVWRLQDHLRQDPVIYPEGFTTGYFGHLTERAVQRFQAKHHIVATGTPATTGYGVFGPKTSSVLFSVFPMMNTSTSTVRSATTTPPVVIYRTLSRGQHGKDVSQLQRLLAEDSDLYPEGDISGYFGAATERAVKRFQMKHNIVATGTPATTGFGVFGGETRRVMMESSIDDPTSSFAPGSPWQDPL